MRISRKALVAGGVLIGLPLLALVALPFILDANQYRPLLQSQLEKRLQRPVALGDAHLQTFPLSIRIADVVIGQPAEFKSPQPFLQAKEVYVGVALWPLLRKEVVMEAIRLQSPHVELIQNPNGHWNYETGPEGQDSESSNVTLDELRVKDGEVALTDLKAGTPRDVYQHIDLTLKNLGPNRRGSVEGSVRLDSLAAALQLQSEFHNAADLTASGTLKLKADRAKDPLDVTFDVKRSAKPAVLTINSLTAKIGTLAAAAAGSINTDRTSAVLDLKVKTDRAPIADLTRLAALFGAQFPPDLKVDGLMQSDLKITGTSAQPLLAGVIEATKAQITAKEIKEPVRASELRVDLTPTQLTTRPFILETGNTRLSAQATVTRYSEPDRVVNATLQTNGAKVEELLRIASAYGAKPEGLNGTGLVTLDMKVTQAGKSLDYSGSGSLRDVTLTSPQLPKPLTIANADIKFTEDRVVFDGLRAGLGSMHLDGNLSLRDFSRPNLQFTSNIDQINIGELQSLTASPQGKSGSSTPASPSKVSAHGAVTIGKVISDQFVLNNVKATLNFANNVLTLDPVTAEVFGGQQAGAIVATLRGAETTFVVRSKLTNLDANQLLSATSSVKGILSGPLSGQADLQFVSRPNEEIAKSLNGRLQMQMGQGRLAGVQILNEVASIGKFLGYTRKQEVFTNILKLSGSFNLVNGLASTDDLFMDLGGSTLSGAGTLGLVDQSLRLKIMTVLGKEFVQRNLPGQAGGLLSTVLANQKGEMVVPALVSGTFASPRFAPDAEQVAKLKLGGLLPTANNPAALSSGVKGLIDAISGKPADPRNADRPQNGILDLVDQFRKKKPK